MSGRALLSVEADIASVQRAFGALRSESRSVSEAIAADFRRIDDSGSRAYRRIRREAGKAAEALVAAERSASEAAEGASRRRQSLATVEANYRTNAFRGVGEGVAQEERRATTSVERESRRRITALRREASERRAIVREMRNAVIGGTVAGVTAAGQAVLGERETAARRERDLNTALGQTAPFGATQTEINSNRAYIMQQIRDRSLDPDRVIEGIGLAQESANALGAATPEGRRAAIDATLNDVQFASAINPNNVNGLTRFGAVLRSQVTDEGMREQIMRSAAGISFSGSVETDTALRQGLQGLMRTISSNTANLRPGQNRDQVVRDTVTDFLAQIQTVAATGGTVGVTANRMTSMRSAFNNADRQNRLGQAFAAREATMTDAQRQSFHSTFTRGADGRYTMNADVANSPDRAAAFFGQQFNNDAVATMNFLGAHGGGGARQLLNRPEVGLLTSYYATTHNARGEEVRQYDAVRDLRRTTLTDEQMRTIQGLRANEDATRLTQEANARSSVLGDRGNWFVRAARGIQGAAAEHPLLASMLGAQSAAPLLKAAGRGIASAGGVGAMARSAGGSIGGLLGLGGSGIIRAVPALAGLATLLHTTDLTAENAASQGGRGGSDARQIAAWRAQHGGGASAPTPQQDAIRAAVSQGVVEGLRQVGGIPVRMSPQDVAVQRGRDAVQTRSPAP